MVSGCYEYQTKRESGYAKELDKNQEEPETECISFPVTLNAEDKKMMIDEIVINKKEMVLEVLMVDNPGVLAKVQTPTTPNDTTSPVNLDPLEEDLLIEDYTCSDGESKMNESLGESKIKVRYEVVKPQVCQQAESSSNHYPFLAITHMTVKHQKPSKACFMCGKDGHVLKKCLKRQNPDGKGNTNCFSGSTSIRNNSMNDQMKNNSFRFSYVKPVSHDSKIKGTKASKPQSFPLGLKQKIVSKFKYRFGESNQMLKMKLIR
ncbi:hypothetical protein L1987_13477 [Smallanthus sonchifolius]|uniref:Uncharacterized protein n=1 Tax=Smallanthus sonchifolius TaxID=185202 RepID=A0ACB9JHK1_9ASTR|nr:hypothetical protein L1987_13477 [Smallanthus sonchifolius]